jgi:hypothetical protein
MSTPMITVTQYRSLDEATDYLVRIAESMAPFTFDIETYDGADAGTRFGKLKKGMVLPPGDTIPSRQSVAVDPLHPDFRVRGVAVATSTRVGVWIDFLGQDPGASSSGLTALRDMFANSAEKSAFNGHFDENGLVYTGSVPRISNRVRDGMLSMIALGDGTHESLKLSHGIATLLRRKYHWNVDKGLMGVLPVEVVADGAVHDACATHALCDLLDGWAADDRRIRWSNLSTTVPATDPEDAEAFADRIAPRVDRVLDAERRAEPPSDAPKSTETPAA